MNVADFNSEFDLKFNNSYSGFAPGIEMFHKSLYLTQAQESVVIEYAKIFETNEEAREILRTLVVNDKSEYSPSLNVNLLTLKLDTNSKLFEVPSDAWYIFTENVDGITVIPKTLDEYNIQKKNPFKKPLDKTKAWRMDVSDTVSATPKNIREIIYPGTISEYKFRYLKKPDPIILEELTGDESIEGDQAASTCKLSSRVHREILDKAVQLAILAFEENNLQNNIQLNQ